MAKHLRARRRIRAISAVGLTLALAGCGGRVAAPTPTIGTFDLRLSCAHIAAETAANLRRIVDLRDERNVNRLRNLTRIPGAILGNPLSAIALADTSRAIYLEIDALEERNKHLDELSAGKRCGEEPPPAPPAMVNVEAPAAAPGENTAGAGPAAPPDTAVAAPASDGAMAAPAEGQGGGSAAPAGAGQ